MQPSISRLAVVVLVLASPVVAGAQEPADSVPKLQPPYLQAVLVEMSYSKLARWNAGASLFLSHDDVGIQREAQASSSADALEPAGWRYGEEWR